MHQIKHTATIKVIKGYLQKGITLYNPGDSGIFICSIEEISRINNLLSIVYIPIDINETCTIITLLRQAKSSPTYDMIKEIGGIL